MDMEQPCKYLQFQKSYFKKGFLSAAYVDDSYFQGNDYEDCFFNVMNTIEILRFLEFTICPDKSKFIPVQYITYLEFILNSAQITIP